MHSENIEMTTELITNVISAWNAHDPDLAARFYAPDYLGLDVAHSEPQHGLSGLRQSMARYFRAFPDIQFSQDSLIIQGDTAALAWTAHATHRGQLMNIPPTGRQVQIQGVSLLTIANGKIRKASYIWDVAGLLRNLGLMPEL